MLDQFNLVNSQVGPKNCMSTLSLGISFRLLYMMMAQSVAHVASVSRCEVCRGRLRCFEAIIEGIALQLPKISKCGVARHGNICHGFAI